MNEKNVFQKIIDREIPAEIVYEDDFVIAFFDIKPVTKGHLLLIPKDSYTWIQDVPDDLLTYSFLKSKELIIAIKKGLQCDFVQVVVEGRDVPHFHIHLIPSMMDHKPAVWEHTSYSDGEIKEYAQKIKNAL